MSPSPGSDTEWSRPAARGPARPWRCWPAPSRHVRQRFWRCSGWVPRRRNCPCETRPRRAAERIPEPGSRSRRAPAPTDRGVLPCATLLPEHRLALVPISQIRQDPDPRITSAGRRSRFDRLSCAGWERNSSRFRRTCRPCFYFVRHARSGIGSVPPACKQWQCRGIGGMADDRVDGRPMEEVGWRRVMGSENSAPRGCATMLLQSTRADRSLSWNCVPSLDPLRTARRRTEMAAARLRLFPYPEDEHEDASVPSIPIHLSDLYPLLAQAYRDNYVWLHDLENDRLMVSNDLYEVIRAFSNCRPSA